MTEYSVEVHFAQKLACNEKRDRDKAVKRLRKYIEAKSSVGKGFDQDELLKLWKGLFFCMWMCDKPLIQEELATKISKLIFAFTRLDGAFNFISTFYTTMKREWYGIDRLRLDKFMLLIRCILQESFELLKSHKWKRSVIKKFLKIMSLGPLSSSDKNSVNGIRFHLMDIYLEVLSSTGAAELTPKQNLNFLQPFCKLLTCSKSNYVLERAQTRVFYAIIYDSELGRSMFPSDDNMEEDEEKEELLKFNYNSIASTLFAEASQKHCRIRNRNFVYTLVKKFKDLVNGHFPLQPDLSSGSDNDLTETDMEAAVMRMQEEECEERERKLWVKKHKCAFPNSQADDDENSDKAAKKQTETTDEHNTLQSDIPSGKSQKQKTRRLKKKRKCCEVEETLKRPDEKMNFVSLCKNATSDSQGDNANDRTAECHIETANKCSNLQFDTVGTRSRGKQDELLKKKKRKRNCEVRTVERSDKQIDVALLDKPAFADNQVDNEHSNEDAKKHLLIANVHNSLQSEKADCKLERKQDMHLKKKCKRNYEVKWTTEKFKEQTCVTQAFVTADSAVNGVNGISFHMENSKQTNNILPSVTEPHGQKTSKAASSLKQKKVKCKNKDSQKEVPQWSNRICESLKGETKAQVKTSISTKSAVNSGVPLEVKVSPFIPDKETTENTSVVTTGEETFASFAVNMTPPAAFVRRAYSKTMSMSEPQKKIKHASGVSTFTPIEHKKVKFVLSNNTRHGHQDYKSAVKASPQIPYDGKRKPSQGLLKSIS